MPSPFRFSRRVGSIIAALAVLVTPALLFAHAQLVRSNPAANSTIATSPTNIDLSFSERPELRFTTVRLTDSAGTAIPLGPIAATDSTGVAMLVSGRVLPGPYTVAWRTAAADGHVTSGTFTFTVAAPASAVATPSSPAISVSVIPPLGGTSNALVQTDTKTTLSTSLRWAELVAVLTLIGVVTFRLAVLPAARWAGGSLSDVNDRLRRLAHAVFVLFVVTTITRATVQSELLPNAGSRATALMTLIRHTQWGEGWAVGAIGALVLLGGLTFTRRGVTGWAVAALGVVGVAVGQTLTGHSVSGRHHALAIAADVAHLLGAGGWLGGLVALLFAGLASVRRLGRSGAESGSRLLQSFHDTATECVIVVIVTALISAWLRVGTWHALWSTPYGNVLLRKSIFVLFMLGLGWYHSRRMVSVPWTDDLVARFRRSVAAELLVGLIVIAFTAILISTPTPT